MRLEIEKLVYGGDGLARLPGDERGPGKAVFVPLVLPGEELEAEITEEKSGFARAKLHNILRPSPQRITALCPYFGSCGGCHYQHTTYENQLALKTEILKENLRRIAKLELPVELKVHAAEPWQYRNRTRLKVQTVPEFALGYYKLGSHELLPIRECPISSPLIQRAIAALWQLGESGLSPLVSEIELFADADDRQLLIELYCAPEIDPGAAQNCVESLKTALPQAAGVAAFRNARAMASLERVASTGEGSLSYRTALTPYRVSAGAFFQVNRFLLDELIEIAIAGAEGKLALDLYAGVGLFSAVLARSFAQVIAVESSQISHSDLAYNSPANLKAVRATTEPYLSSKQRKLHPDLVVVDPPRSGLGEKLCRILIQLKSPVVTYVSCDPATLARDLRTLLANGYRITEAHFIDLFPQTFHIESVFRLAR